MTVITEDLPPCLIHIDKEGRLFHQGAEMIHAGINSLLLENISEDEQGRFVIEFKGQRCWVEVEDTPIVVQRAAFRPEEPVAVILHLSDGAEEELNPELLWISQESVIYTRIRAGSLLSRFSRPAYYQLAERIVEKGSGFALSLGSRAYELKPGRP